MKKKLIENPRTALLVQALLREARAYASRGDELACLRAVIVVDMAVEQTLHCIVNAYDDSQGDADGIKFTTLWQSTHGQLKTLGETGLLHGAKAKTMRRMRNLAMHSGSPPNAMDLVPLIEKMSETCRHALLTAFDIDLHAFRFWDLAGSSALSRHLAECEEAIATNPLLALAGLRVAFNSIEQIVVARIGELPGQVPRERLERLIPKPGVPTHIDTSQKSIYDVITKLADDTNRSLVSVRTHIAFADLGVPLVDTVQFLRRFAGFSVNVANSGDWCVVERQDVRTNAKENAINALEYVGHLVSLVAAGLPGILSSFSLVKTLKQQPVGIVSCEPSSVGQ